MSVTVKQALELDVLRNAKIVAGGAHLNRAIRRVSFIDSPITPDVLEKGILMPGDFFIGSLFVVKDDLGQMLKIIELLLASESSGLCVISEFFMEFPPEIVGYADEHGFPIVFIDRDIPYADVIRDVFVLILHDKEDDLIEMKLDGMLESEQDEERVRKTILGINGDSGKYLMALYGRSVDLANNKLVFLKDAIGAVKGWTCLRFREGVLILLTFNDPDESVVAPKARYAIDLLRSAFPHLAAGVSELHGLGRAGRAVTEALVSSEARQDGDRGPVYYRSLGVSKFLLPLRDEPELREFHDGIIAPILAYDRNYRQNLLATATCFVDCDGDYSKTAERMFLHENSIRYRIDKIAELLGARDKRLMFHAQLAVAVKLHELLADAAGPCASP